MRVLHAFAVIAIQLGIASWSFAADAEKPPIEQGREILENSKATINWPPLFVREGMLYATHAYALTEIVQTKLDLSREEKDRVEQLTRAYIEAVTAPVRPGQIRSIQPMEAFHLKKRRLELLRQLALAEGNAHLENRIRGELGKIESGRVFGKFDMPPALSMAIGSELREEIVPRYSEIALRWELLYPVLPSDSVFGRLGRALSHPDVGLTPDVQASAGKILSQEVFKLGRFRRRQTDVVEAEFPRIYAACTASMTPAQRAALMRVMLELDACAARLEWIASGPGLEPKGLIDHRNQQDSSKKREKDKPRIRRRPS